MTGQKIIPILSGNRRKQKVQNATPSSSTAAPSSSTATSNPSNATTSVVKPPPSRRGPALQTDGRPKGILKTRTDKAVRTAEPTPDSKNVRSGATATNAVAPRIATTSESTSAATPKKESTTDKTANPAPAPRPKVAFIDADNQVLGDEVYEDLLSYLIDSKERLGLLKYKIETKKFTLVPMSAGDSRSGIAKELEIAELQKSILSPIFNDLAVVKGKYKPYIRSPNTAGHEAVKQEAMNVGSRYGWYMANKDSESKLKAKYREIYGQKFKPSVV